MGENVSYKVWLRDHKTQLSDASSSADATPEVRRFVVDKDVSTSLCFLQQKLVSLFPRLKQDLFEISWTDEDGDVVTIGTDEELIIALTEMKGPLYKVIVTVKPGKAKDASDRDSSRPR